MKKVFIDNLPTLKSGRNKGYIDWRKSIGYSVNFVYNYIEGTINIISFYKKNNKLYLKVDYKNNIYSIRTDALLSARLGEILFNDLYGYKYNIGDIVNEKLKILEQISIPHCHSKGRNSTYDKGYKYQCLICGNKDTLTETQVINNIKCNVCSNQKILKGYNDMWTTNPNLAKLLANPKDGYKYTQNSNKKVDWLCPNCGNIIKNKLVYQINKNNLSCSKCGDGISYPNKFMYSFLSQTNVNFETEYNPDWIKPRRYDFYFELNNKKYIVEMDGKWHKIDNKLSGQLAEESKEIDEFKNKLANEHGISIIRINSEKSQLEFIKNNILNSKLAKIFDLTKIDWNKCEEFAYKSLVKKVCDLWNKENDVLEITKLIKISKTTVRKYLKQGTELGWCNYNPKDELKKTVSNNGKKHIVVNKRKVICLNNQEIFDSILEASKCTNINSTLICNCCKGRTKYASKKSKLQWQYYDEYLENPKEITLLSEDNKSSNDNRKKKVICLNNKKIFNSIMDANAFYNIKSKSGISECCTNNQKSAGKHPKTHEKLRWMFYEDYLNFSS